jgi:hypothetical protein
LVRVLRTTEPRSRRQIGVEAPIPDLDRRSIDLRLDGPGASVVCEVETRVGSLEEIIRELHAKRDAVRSALSRGPRADMPTYAVLIQPRTRHHEAVVREHPRPVEATFPMRSDAMAAALQDAMMPWSGDGILWSRGAPKAGAKAVAKRAPDTLGGARPHRLEA